eukprot:2103347-Pyramimonas_sp.AAC.1
MTVDSTQGIGARAGEGQSELQLKMVPEGRGEGALDFAPCVLASLDPPPAHPRRGGPQRAPNPKP